MIYDYIALDSSGKKIIGKIEANSLEDLKIKLRRNNMILIKLEKKSFLNIKLKEVNFERVKTKDIAVFTRGLSTMINAGVGLIRCFEILEYQIEKKFFKEVVSNIREEIISGISLSIALGKYPKYFNNLYISMVKAGESSGTLDIILLRIATSLEKNQEIKGKVKSAIIYPAIVFIATSIVMFLMLAFVIPKFMVLFEGTGVEMPALTKLVMRSSVVASRYWYLFILIVMIIIISFKKIIKTEKGNYILDSILIKIPLIGTFLRRTAMARFTRTMATLLNSGVSILMAFDITSEVVGNSLVKKAILEAKSSIRDGASISKPLSESGQFPPMVTDMIEVGEESGQLSEILEKVAEFTELELEEAVRNLLAAFEPLMILFMAVGIGVLIIAMFLPLFQMSEIVG